MEQPRARALPAGDQAARPPVASGHREDPRRRHRPFGRVAAPVLRDGVRGRAVAVGVAAGRAADAARDRGALRGDRRGGGVLACARDHASRPEAEQHPGDGGGKREDPRLWRGDGSARRRPRPRPAPHADHAAPAWPRLAAGRRHARSSRNRGRLRRRHAALHVARADLRHAARRRAQRPLLARRDAVRGALREAPVRPVAPVADGRGDGDPQRDPDDARPRRPRAARGPRGHRLAPAREAAGRPLPERAAAARRPRAIPAGPARAHAAHPAADSRGPLREALSGVHRVLCRPRRRRARFARLRRLPRRRRTPRGACARRGRTRRDAPQALFGCVRGRSRAA